MKMFIKKILLLLCVFGVMEVSLSSDVKTPKHDVNWTFEGVFGYFDKQSIQRGFKVYREVCQVCHSLKYLEYSNLGKIGFSEDEVKAIAASYTVHDGPNDSGDMFDRPGRLSDRFVSPYPNEQAARAANNGAYPADLSLMIKARKDGANYVYSVLTGYETAPEGVTISDGLFYNPYFPGHQIAMPPPLTAGMVAYTDGTEDSMEQMSKDVVNFLQWAAEPEMETRKIMGIKVLLYLVVFTVIFYLVKRKIWKDVK